MDRHDFDRFVAESTDGLLRTAYLIAGDLHEAEDLVQETLFKVAQRWPRVSRMDHPAAYARRILVNLALRGEPKRSRRRAELSEMRARGRRAAWRCARHRARRPRRAPRRACGAARRASARCSSCATSWTFPKPRWRPHSQCSLGTVKSTASRGLARLEQTLRPTNDTRSIAS